MNTNKSYRPIIIEFIDKINENVRWLNESILNVDFVDEEPLSPPEGYLTVQQFTSKHLFIANNTLNRYCNRQLKNHAVKVKNEWYLNENKALELFKSIPVFKNKMQRQPEKYGHLLNV